MVAISPKVSYDRFDLQAVLTFPYAGNYQVYHKWKLSLFNSTREWHCFLWGETNGKKGSSEIVTCLLKYIGSLNPAVDHLVLYAATCGGQNRNQSVLPSLFYTVNTAPNLDIIDLKLMESGHSYLEADSIIHATIIYTHNTRILTAAVMGGRGIECYCCKKNINRRYDETLECSACTLFYHRTCTNVDLDYYRKLLDEKTKWECDSCITLSSNDSDQNVNKQISPAKMSPGNLPKVTDDLNLNLDLSLSVPKIQYLGRENEFLRIKNLLLKKLVQEMEDKNKLLQEKLENLSVKDKEVPEAPIEIKSTVIDLESPSVSEKQPLNLKRKTAYSEVAGTSKKINDIQKLGAQEINTPVAHVSTGKVATKSNNNVVDESDHGFIMVKNKRKRKVRPSIVGTDTENTLGFESGVGKTWLYLGRVKNSVDSEIVVKYIKTKLKDDEDILCEEVNQLGIL